MAKRTTPASLVARVSSRLDHEVAVRKALPRWRADYDDVETFCQFLGFPRSGHTLYGALLSVHPDVVVAIEANALQMVRSGASRDDIYRTLLSRDLRFVQRGCRWSGYDYTVPGQWQGRYRHLRVIGDKKGGGSARLLRDDPGLLDRLGSVVGVPVMCIVITRNPFDNVARISTRNKISVAEAIDLYQAFATGVGLGISQLPPARLLTLRHEDFVADPEAHLRLLAQFVGVEPLDDWVDQCAARVFSSPRRARDDVKWSDEDRSHAERLLDDFEFLASYQSED